ncbi:hypothetical protein BXT89_11100 [Halopseudomonas pachastrellae]|uniref:Transposase n=1 Tax=Halopseudomonas pachastrellae TaxID=254161 RepID=A0A1S8DE85_9GAMM|nr:hypothetical protein BXT89_11100 [Halopseudomonas pachastrellae]
MSRQRRSFSVEFKHDAAALVVDQGYSVAEACKSMGVGETALRRWVDQLREERSGVTPKLLAQKPEQFKSSQTTCCSPTSRSHPSPDLVAVPSLRRACSQRACLMGPQNGAASSGVVRHKLPRSEFTPKATMMSVCDIGNRLYLNAIRYESDELA